MYQGKAIWKRLFKNSDWIKGRVMASTIKEKVDEIISPYRAKTKIINQKFNNKKTAFMIGGEFAPDVFRKPITIEICVSAQTGYIYFTKRRKERFMFLISQTLQHELIHLNQFKNRGCENFYTHYYNFSKGQSRSSLQKLEYYAMVEEIDAFAHDLAMEICYFYPDLDYKNVLKDINHFDLLDTWKVYRRTFKKARWIHVRNELLRKTYRWLPVVKMQYGWLTK